MKPHIDELAYVALFLVMFFSFIVIIAYHDGKNIPLSYYIICWTGVAEWIAVNVWMSPWSPFWPYRNNRSWKRPLNSGSDKGTL